MGGFFGVVSNQDCVSDVFYGTDYHSHLGTKRGGMAVINSSGIKRSIHNIQNNYFRTKFEPDLPKLQGRQGIGVISDFDAQPLIVSSHLGTFGIVTVGKIKNIEALTARAFSHRRQFSEILTGGDNPTEIVASLICEEESFEAGIQNVFSQIEGSCSMLILGNEGIYAARDKLGRTPIAIGYREGAFAVASENCAFPNLGYEDHCFLGPGEIVLITAEGVEQRIPPGDSMQVCAFLWVYYGYPASDYEHINVEWVRNNCGAALARRDEEEIDFVAGIPDSGIGHAIGYAGEKRIPYLRPFVKYTPTWPRSFMPQNQEMRDLVAKMKLIPVKRLIDGQRILFCEDSIVRGTQLKDNIEILYECGAREIHMRPACPCLIHPCEFLNFSTSRSTLDLAGRQMIKKIEGAEDKNLEEYAEAGSDKNLEMIDLIRQQLKLTSLKYQSLGDLVDAIGLPKAKLCTHCWDGTSYY